MNRTVLIVVGAVAGSFLLLCGACTVAFVLLPTTSYTAPWEPCAEVTAAPVAELGRVAGQRTVTDSAVPGCVVTFEAGGPALNLTVLLDTPSTSSDATDHYETAHALAAVRGTVTDVSGVGTAAFLVTNRGDTLTVELHVRDANLFASLTLVADPSLPPARARGQLVAVVEALMSALEGSSSGGDWDD